MLLDHIEGFAEQLRQIISLQVLSAERRQLLQRQFCGAELREHLLSYTYCGRPLHLSYVLQNMSSSILEVLHVIVHKLAGFSQTEARYLGSYSC